MGVKKMKKLSFLTRSIGGMFACMALIVAQLASTQFSLIYYQDEVPKKVKDLRKNR